MSRPLHGAGTVLRRTLARERRPIVGWAVGIGLLVLVTAGSWPAIESTGADFQELLDNLPDALTAFFGEGIADFSAAGVVGSRLYGSVALIVVIGYAISRGARAIAGEEAAGTLELLVTQPVTRTAIAVAKAAAALVVLGGLVGVELVALLVLMPIVGLDFALSAVLAASLGLYLLAAMFGMLAFAVGAGTGNRGLAVVIGAGTASVLFLLTGFGGLVEGLEPAAAVSPFTVFDGTVVLTEGLDPSVPAVFAAVGVLLVVVGTWLFTRRDLS